MLFKNTFISVQFGTKVCDFEVLLVASCAFFSVHIHNLLYCLAVWSSRLLNLLQCISFSKMHNYWRVRERAREEEGESEWVCLCIIYCASKEPIYVCETFKIRNDGNCWVGGIYSIWFNDTNKIAAAATAAAHENPSQFRKLNKFENEKEKE